MQELNLSGSSNALTEAKLAKPYPLSYDCILTLH